MSNRVLCLRPEADFTRVDAAAPKSLAVAYHAPTDATVAGLMKSSDALVIPAVGPKLAPELFEGTSLKLVQVTGAGVDRLDQAALTRLGIPVANVAGGSNSAVAEYAVTTASVLLRRFCLGRRRDQGRQLRQIPRPHGGRQSRRHRGLAGRPDRLRHHRPRGGAGVRPDGCEGRLLRSGERGRQGHRGAVDALGELLATSDVVSLHVPLLPETQNLIGAAQLSCMKPGAVLIQASRGGIVDEAALAASLTSGHLGGAAVDVYATEPPASDNPAAEAHRRSSVAAAC